ncbi:enoyl-CoA hydratase/isomerase family protein [Microthyrium microscopicum]|uniref:Enoyl-CoA hydratase/isomerase family protein n=1 Tax=Microthyrium microscopicum TaxID=703497 RepID=A0A6A6UAX3_9PEZI|nr:enoyl-CoA hydratase/isomerase family protein [Microthyrium microscopicum]
MTELFRVPVASTGGHFACTSPAKDVYLLSFQSVPDNRTTSDFLSAYLLSLNIIEAKYPGGVLITTSAIAKFFSNGLDLEHTMSTPDFFRDRFNPIIRKLLTFPMPTIALMNGHAFGAGVFLAAAHDYRIQNGSKGFICLPEVDMGILLPSTLAILVKQKLLAPNVYRDLTLEGRRVNGPEALAYGLVDGLGGLEEVLKLISDRKLIQKSKAGAIGGLKEDAYREIITAIDGYDQDAEWRDALEKRKKADAAKNEELVAQWEKKSGSKL